MRTISFITANYVARASNYNGSEDWGTHDRATSANANAATFQKIAQDVSGAGFEAIDIWTAHCHWIAHAKGDYVEQVKGICSNFDLAITSYAGGVHVNTPADLEAPLRFMKQLGAPMFAGGVGGKPTAELMPMVQAACEKFDRRWAYENHPEKTPAEIMEKIGGGDFSRVGVALDTGWCGTHGMDALEAAKVVREKLFIVHLKDVKAVGGHDTCALGEGVVAVEKVVRFLVESGWEGTIGIEHEPYDRDPMPEVKRSLERLKQWLK